MKIIESEHEIELKSITGQIATGKNGATFLVARDGKEIVLRDIPIDVRDGQWVTLIHLIHVRDTYPLYIYNHTTDQEYLYKRVL
ncbi:MAG: hypothetical protein NZL92_12575, partial [Gloeomargarita sp. SKYG116]|nr:hypothetical protein [Gloeomargarita sp. SKYG116]MDW8402514.1 hypothetical protein [Gloeomargarita sp. SKYGB_i_bin116]